MNFRKLLVGATCLAAVLCVPVAQATFIKWKLVDVTFDDAANATLTGFFTMDNVSGLLGTWDITAGTGNASFPGFEYTSSGGGSGSGSGGSSFELCRVVACATGVVLDMEFDSLLGANPPNPAAIVYANSDEFNPANGDVRNLDSGHLERVFDVPEPSIMALLGLGLAGLGFSRKRA